MSDSDLLQTYSRRGSCEDELAQIEDYLADKFQFQVSHEDGRNALDGIQEMHRELKLTIEALERETRRADDNERGRDYWRVRFNDLHSAIQGAQLLLNGGLRRCEKGN